MFGGISMHMADALISPAEELGDKKIPIMAGVKNRRAKAA
ncbi:hypothetical protein AGMMS49944_29510 [Spirochaetia bacterium]|nr:hypothetical protein AGMMS49944_29510 [Spirochaetia bacterium]